MRIRSLVILLAAMAIPDPMPRGCGDKSAPCTFDADCPAQDGCAGICDPSIEGGRCVYPSQSCGEA